jgi:hypothetical protein
VLVIAAAAAILALGHRGPAGPRPQAGHTGPTAGTSSPAASHPAAAPSAGNSVLAVAKSAAAAPHAAAVVSFLTRYFSAINAHNYDAYRRLFSASLRGGLSASAFSAGYGSTRDSGAVLHSISVVGPGRLTALVTFTSHQQAADSATHSSCTAWRIELYLLRQGHRYVLESPPGRYRAFASSCS